MFSFKHKIILIVSLAAGIAAGGAVSLFQKPYVEASRSFVVQNRRNAAAQVYDYEGYYTLQTANEAAKSLVSWLTSPGGVHAVYNAADIQEEFTSLRSYERAFSLRRSETPFFEVRYRTEMQIDAEKMSASLEKNLRAELESFQGSESLTLGSSQAVILFRPVPLLRNLAYGAFLAFVLALFGMLFRNAMKSEN